MITEYGYRATIFGPPSKLDDLNQLALVLGESASDDQTFRSVNCEHPETGERYCVVSTVVKTVFADMAGKPLAAPSHAPNADIEAASRAQALLSINDKLPSQDHIAVRIGPNTDSVMDHISEYGLALIPAEV